jgi:hypothetical protein
VKDKTTKELNELYEQARTMRARFEGDWYMNLAYYQGDQWLGWNGSRLYEPKLRSTQLTLVDNRIMPAVRTEVAVLTRQRPTWTVLPPSADDDDETRARLAEKILDAKWRDLKLSKQLLRALEWSRVCSAGFWKIIWDSTYGAKTDVLVGADGSPMGRADRFPDQVIQLAQQQGGEVRQVANGDACIEVRSPFQMVTDPLPDEFDESEWIIEEIVKSSEYVQERYGVDLKPDTPAQPGMVERIYNARSGSRPYMGVKLREYWNRSQGRRVVWAKDKILADDSNVTDPFPYVMFPGISVPGRLWPTTITEQMRPMQTELNKSVSTLGENANRIGNPITLRDRTQNANWQGLPGEVVDFDGIGSPTKPLEFLGVPEVPQYVQNRLEQLQASIEAISGQHEVTQGAVPPGVTAAAAISLLQEAYNTMLGPDVDEIGTAIQTAAKKVLGLVSRFYTTEQTVRIAGDDGAWEFVTFKGAMLGKVDELDVQVDSLFPQSKAAKQAAMSQLLTTFVQNGVPIEARALRKFLKEYDIAGLEHLVGSLSSTEFQISWENRQLAQGAPLPINSYDEDADHIAGHEEWQRTASYRKLPDLVKQNAETHVNLHRARIAQAGVPSGAPGPQLQLPLPQNGAPPSGMVPQPPSPIGVQ